MDHEGDYGLQVLIRDGDRAAARLGGMNPDACVCDRVPSNRTMLARNLEHKRLRPGRPDQSCFDFDPVSIDRRRLIAMTHAIDLDRQDARIRLHHAPGNVNALAATARPEQERTRYQNRDQRRSPPHALTAFLQVCRGYYSFL